MTAYPRATATLLSVLGIDGENAQLPLDVLINLHRRQLRQPLEKLATLVSAPKDEDEAWDLIDVIKPQLDKDYPNLADGRLFIEHRERLDVLTETCGTHYGDPDDKNTLKLAGMPSALVSQLILRGLDEWSVYEPMTLLHRLSWEDAPLSPLLETLEIELGLSPEVGRMLSEYAAI